MGEYVHRKTVLDTIRRNSMLRVQDIYDAVESLPVVNVGQERGTPNILHCSNCGAEMHQAKSGKWVNVRHMLAKGKWAATCSKCGKEHVFEGTLPDACPYCGCTMDGGQDK